MRNRIVLLGVVALGLMSCGSDPTSSPSVEVAVTIPSTDPAAAAIDVPASTDVPATDVPATDVPATDPPDTVATTDPVGTEVPSAQTGMLMTPIPAGSIVAGDDDLIVLHADGDLWLHPGILGDAPGAPVRLVDLDDPSVPIDEGSGPNVIEQIAGVVDGSVIYGDCCEPIAGNLFAVASPGAEPVLLGFGFQPKLDPSRTTMATANPNGVGVVDLASGVIATIDVSSLAPGAFPLDLAWTSDTTFVVLTSDDSQHFSLVPVTVRDVAHPAVDVGALVPLDVPFGIESAPRIGLLGPVPTGGLAIMIGDVDPDAPVTLQVFDAETLLPVPDAARTVSATGTDFELGPDAERLIWANGGELRYEATSETPARTLLTDVVAAWFP